MLKLSLNAKIYALCPLNLVTGGVELIHQLVDLLNRSGRETYVVYYDVDTFKLKEPAIPKAYLKYSIRTASAIEDDKDNVVILSETIFHLYRDFSSVQFIFWWLSINNYFLCANRFIPIGDYFKWKPSSVPRLLLSKLYNYTKAKNYPLYKYRYSIKKLRELNALSAYQSEYAHSFLLKMGFRVMLPLKDFINKDFIAKCRTIDVEEKRNRVLYNPKKGYAFTRKLMKSAPQLEWIALEGMTREEMISHLLKAKVYIDFGNHPGKDRIPREAAIAGCCVITGRDGSAAFYEDICIPEMYKIEARRKNIPRIIELIESVFKDYVKRNEDFDFYRKRIKEEENEFIRNVKDLFLS